MAQHRPQNRPQHVIGIDFGTLSGRTVVVAASDGEELGMGEFHYPHGVMDPELAQTGEPSETPPAVPSDPRRGPYPRRLIVAGDAQP